MHTLVGFRTFGNFCRILTITPCFWAFGKFCFENWGVFCNFSYNVWEFGWIEPHRHTAGGLKPDFRCMVISVLNRHGIMSEEYNKTAFGFG